MPEEGTHDIYHYTQGRNHIPETQSTTSQKNKQVIEFIPQEFETLSEDEFETSIVQATSLSDLPDFTDTILGDSKADIGILLVHGYSGTNLEMLYIANFLAMKASMRIAIPLLPGHGTNYKDLEQFTYNDWIAKVDNAYRFLKKEKPDRQIVAIGHSLGGSLIFNLATKAELQGLVSIAGPIKYPFYAEILAKAAGKTNLSVPYDNLKFYNDSLSNHPALEYLMDNYNKVPLTTLNDVFESLNGAHKALEEITIPVSLMYSREDPIVPSYHVDTIVNDLKSDDIEISWFYNSYHVLVIDEDRELLSNKIWAFISRVLKLI